MNSNWNHLGNAEECKKLLSQGANVNHVDPNGNNILHI